MIIDVTLKSRQGHCDGLQEGIKKKKQKKSQNLSTSRKPSEHTNKICPTDYSDTNQDFYVLIKMHYKSEWKDGAVLVLSGSDFLSWIVRDLISPYYILCWCTWSLLCLQEAANHNINHQET